MTLESALIPIPSEVTMPFAASIGIFNFWVLVTIGSLANLFGSLLAYALGYLGEDKIPKIFKNKEYYHAVELFNKYGEMIVFVSRILPAIRTYISLPAGIAKMDWKKFTLYTFIGCFIWSTILTYLGLILGSNWHQITPYFHILDIIVIIGALSVLAYFGIKSYNRKHDSKRNAS